MRRAIITLSTLLFFISATISDKGGSYKVRYKGALKNIMHKGDISAKANLLDFENTKNIYALGAVENLKGEILILDGKPFISSVVDGQLAISNTLEHKAALFVYSIIESWKTFEIPQSIRSYAELEKHIAQVARKNNIDINEPFPFLMKGTAKAIEWHVIDWKDGDMEHSHDKHINSGINDKVDNVDVEILGFYSSKHHTIFTHHSTNMHMHIKTTNNKLSGHLDDIQLGSSMQLLLPSVD